MADTSPVVCAGVVVADHLCTPIERLPRSGELVRADELVLALGGCASNAAVCLARQGLSVQVCGCVGNDVFGRFVSETLESQRVDVAALRVDEQESTGQTLIINVRGEDRRFVHAFGANRAFSIADIDRAIQSRPRVFYLGGYLILPGLDPHELAQRFALLRKQGTTVVLDVATAGRGDSLALLEPVLRHTDVFLPNTDEAELILGELDPVRQADAFRELGARRVVITRGEDGAISVSDSQRVRIGIYPMPFMDASGGGDAFDAGYIAGLLRGLDELGCLSLASALGSSCIRAVGATAGVFTRAEADAFMALHTLPIERL